MYLLFTTNILHSHVDKWTYNNYLNWILCFSKLIIHYKFFNTMTSFLSYLFVQSVIYLENFEGNTFIKI